MKIVAATLFKKNTVKIISIKLPKIKFGQILIKIKYSSICHTQLQEILGLRGKDKFLPHCLGHEATGVVVNIGKGVKKVKAGDYVCLTWVKSEGINAGGVKYFYKKKIINGGPVNTFSNYSIVSENKVIKLPKKSNLKKSVLMGCAIPTAFNAIFRTLGKTDKKNIIIFGTGGLGLACIYAAKIAGFKKIFALDMIQNKLNISKKFGATKTILVKKNNFDQKMKKYKNYFSNGIECSGSLDLMKKSISTIKNFGGKLIIVGNYPSNKLIDINPWNFIMGKTITGAWQDQLNYDYFFKNYYKKLKKFNYKLYFGRKIYNLNNINKAIRDFHKGKVIRPLIKM